MDIDPNRDLLRALEALGAGGAFCCRHSAGAQDLQLEITGVGPLRLPLSARRARSLLEVARPARFGKGSRTILDREVRDTWEIARSRVRINQRRWRRTLEPELEAIRDELGLPQEVRLRARLDKLLVYEPGQFFRPHQDSERDDDMVGTLAVVLPSRYRGGSEIIELQGEKVRYTRTRNAERDLTFIAFYADCHHEVRPVTEGYRVVLVYQLLADGSRAAPRAAVPAAVVDSLAATLERYFETPVQIRSWQPAACPEKLVYLLDHQYSQRSLDWHRLKGADGARAAALREAAARAGCEVHLALADIHETWDCIDERPGRDRWGRGRWGRGGYGDDAGEPEHLELVDLIDGHVELRHLIDAGGKAKRIASVGVSERELCFTTANDELEPQSSEYEPYMGNYGNTLERWYHRAAVVIWPRSLDFAMRARSDPSRALTELSRMLRKGQQEEAQAAVRSVASDWQRAVHEVKSRNLLARTMKVCAALDDAELAAELLLPFRLTDLEPGCVAPLAGLCTAHGGEWVLAQLARCDEQRRRYREQGADAWEPRLAALCEAIRAEGSPPMEAIARWLPAHEWERIRAIALEELADRDRPVAAEGLRDIAARLVHVADAAVAAGAPEVRDAIVHFLTAPEHEVPTDALVFALRAARERIAPARLARLGLAPLAAHAAGRLEATLAEPERSAGDWSIRAPMRCTCELCEPLRRFLESARERTLEWPLAQARRQHVHHQLDAYALPVDHVTRRQGRPYTLVLTKREELFAHEARRRKERRADLTWLGQQRRHFG